MSFFSLLKRDNITRIPAKTFFSVHPGCHVTSNLATRGRIVKKVKRIDKRAKPLNLKTRLSGYLK